MNALTPAQVQVAQLFFSLPESEHFLAAGGAALVAAGLTNRPTGDLDLFTAEPGTVLPAMRALVSAAESRGWPAEVFRAADTYVRIIITAEEPVEIDLALDARPERPPVVTVLGPSLDPVELAGHKLLALFGRALPRDLADVYDLAQRFGTDELVRSARRIDAGFDTRVLASMIQQRLALVDDEDLPHPTPAAVRAFHAQWAQQLQDDAQ